MSKGKPSGRQGSLRSDNEKPIPANLQDEFCGFMEANQDTETDDGSWFAKLENTALQFMESKQLPGDLIQMMNPAVYQFLEALSERQKTSR